MINKPSDQVLVGYTGTGYLDNCNAKVTYRIKAPASATSTYFYYDLIDTPTSKVYFADHEARWWTQSSKLPETFPKPRAAKVVVVEDLDQ